jgi:uncharacterized protein involved in type VI secretion and phage assembly
VLSEFREFVTNLRQYGLEFFGLYYGPYRARVVNNADPKGLARVQIECPRARLTGLNGVWLLPMMAGAGDRCGVFWPPEEGETVWVFFDNGNFSEPACYLGGWFSKDEIHEDMAPTDGEPPTRRGLMSPGGHRLVFEDKEGDEAITIEHKDGQIFQITSDGKVKSGKRGGSFEPMMKGTTVKAYLEGHTHPHSWGPTGPPIQPFPPKGLSDDTETS